MSSSFLTDLSVQLAGTFFAAFIGALSAVLMARWDTRRREHRAGVQALQRLFFDLNRRRALDRNLQSSERPGLNVKEDRERVRLSITEARDLAISTASLLPATMEKERGGVLVMVALCNSYLEQQEVSSDYSTLLVQLSEKLTKHVEYIASVSPKDKLVTLVPGAGSLRDLA